MAFFESASAVLRRMMLWIGIAAVLATVCHVSIDVTARAITGEPIPATVELVSRYYMVAITFLPLALVEREDAMISVELIDGFAGPTLLKINAFLVSMLCIAVYLMLFYVTWRVAVSNFSTGTFIVVLNNKLPIWPSYFLPPIGFALAALERAGVMIRGRTTQHGERA